MCTMGHAAPVLIYLLLGTIFLGRSSAESYDEDEQVLDDDNDTMIEVRIMTR